MYPLALIFPLALISPPNFTAPPIVNVEVALPLILPDAVKWPDKLKSSVKLI